VENGIVVSSKTSVAEFDVPSDVGHKMNGFGNYSHGLGVERYQANLLDSCDVSNGDGWKLLTQQFSEMEDALSSKFSTVSGLTVSPVLMRASGLKCHSEFGQPSSPEAENQLMLFASAADKTNRPQFHQELMTEK
jgi:hypothetical protein